HSQSRSQTGVWERTLRNPRFESRNGVSKTDVPKRSLGTRIFSSRSVSISNVRSPFSRIVDTSSISSERPATSIHVHKLIRVIKRPAEGREAVSLDQPCSGGLLRL